MSTRTSARPLVRTAVAAAALAVPLLTAQAAPAADSASAPADSSPGSSHTGPGSDGGAQGVFLSVSGSGDSWIRGVVLHCEPVPHGHHPRAAETCAALDAAHGDLDALPAGSGRCTMQYDPVTVAARGSHRGQAVNWKKTFANACVMHQATGPVFDF
ncbi:SSI family serine proteinase inhibitor [Streptomyces sp. WMMB303]|uniref:SSI family serine proteinase inhibitor n=1 Tax=unclassified Streptomyces TaxID=2593676 RepID=UPI0023EC7C8E|nr:SSI family serine proteinase inhibitor [Streptomyces sp. WMMB303]MDF4249836.1 SSI family serine proteinase inhibitor [Streptomyces sp. WMMB303]